MRSSERLTRDVGFRLRGRNCRASVYSSKRRKLCCVGRQDRSLIVLSQVLPSVSNVAILRRTEGGRISAPIVVLATLKRLRSGLAKLGNNTSSCVIGPFTFRRLLTEVRYVIQEPKE